MRRRPLALVLCTLVALQPLSAPAATVTFRNGDRLTGRILSLFEGKLILATEHAGEVAADWKEVVALASDEPIVLYVASGERIEGQILDLQGGWLGVKAADGVRTIALPMITAINTRPARPQSDRRRHLPESGELPGVLEGGIEVGSLHAWGNTEDLGTSARLWLGSDTRLGRFDLSLSALLADGADDERGMEEILALRHERDVARGFYAFGLLEVEHDEHERIDVRAVLAPGIGRTLAAGDAWDLAGEVGLGFSHTDPDAGTDAAASSSLEAHAGLCATFDLPARSTLTAELRLFGGREVRSLSRLSLGVPLAERLRLDAAVVGRTDSEPVPGVEKSDVQLRVGVAVEF